MPCYRAHEKVSRSIRYEKDTISKKKNEKKTVFSSAIMQTFWDYKRSGLLLPLSFHFLRPLSSIPAGLGVRHFFADYRCYCSNQGTPRNRKEPEIAEPRGIDFIFPRRRTDLSTLEWLTRLSSFRSDGNFTAYFAKRGETRPPADRFLRVPSRTFPSDVGTLTLRLNMKWTSESL